MSFYETYRRWREVISPESYRKVTKNDVILTLKKDKLDDLDLLRLLSPAAGDCLEVMAQKAHQLTVQHFGRTIVLFAPLYVSDYCVNSCTYCSFSIENDFPRKRLAPYEIEREGAAIAATGIKHLLLLTGESPQKSDLDYLKGCIQLLSRYFSSISLEVQPMDVSQYVELIGEGVDGMTVYQETYDEETYRELHRKGPKRNYKYRLDAPERACQAGMRTVTIGPLLGLADWREEVFFAGMHARYLQERYPAAEISVSFPRIRPHLGSWSPGTPVYDKELVQAMLAMRLLLPRAGVTLSTRESSEFRNRLLRLGVTKMSAGSCTAVGGYTDDEASFPQFETSDERSVDQIRKFLQSQGYQPIMTDWPKFNSHTVQNK